MNTGDPVDQQGMLLRSGGGFVLQDDLGEVVQLELSRMPVDLVAKRVRVTGHRSGDGKIEVHGIQAAGPS